VALLDLAPIVRSRLEFERAWRTARRPLPTFMVIPRGPMLWGQDKPTTVRCRACGSILRPGVKREVRMLDKGLWEHVDCRTAARVPRGARGLEKLLRGSVRS
jgi:hypothetical protein